MNIQTQQEWKIVQHFSHDAFYFFHHEDFDMELMTHTAGGIDKIARYGWVTKDAPGLLQMLHKDVLRIHPDYQREAVMSKVREIAAVWSWLSLGVLVVAFRDGIYWVIDGQHRLLAALRRSDITTLPCVVFETETVKEEARGFLGLNTGRKPVTALAKQKALLASGDEVAAYVHEQFEALGIRVKKMATHANEITCVAWCMRRATENKDTFREVLQICSELSVAGNMQIPERVLEGLWIINAKCGTGLSDKRLLKRVREKGVRVLLDAANRAAAYYANGGGKVWAQGMLAEINKGLINRFTMDGAEA